MVQVGRVNDKRRGYYYAETRHHCEHIDLGRIKKIYYPSPFSLHQAASSLKALTVAPPGLVSFA